jgi:hypothetical protein
VGQCVWVPESELRSRTWLALARSLQITSRPTVSGFILKTTGPALYLSGKIALTTRSEKIFRCFVALADYSSHLEPQFINRRVVNLRRDLQRPLLMLDGKAVLPTAVLDPAWAGTQNREDKFLALLETSGIELRDYPKADIMMLTKLVEEHYQRTYSLRNVLRNGLPVSNGRAYWSHDKCHTAASYLGMNGIPSAEIAVVFGLKILAMIKHCTQLGDA